MRKFPWIRLIILIIGAIIFAFFGSTRAMPVPTHRDANLMGLGVLMVAFGVFSLHYWPVGQYWHKFLNDDKGGK